MMKKLLILLFGDFHALRIKDSVSGIFPGKKKKKQAAQRIKFYSSFVKKNDLCFDVGANIGNRISPLLEIGSKVVAVEPQEVCYRFLQHKFGKKIEIVPKGLGETEGIKDFHLSSASQMSSFSEEWINSVKNVRFKKYNWNKTTQVEITTLDKLIEKYGQPEFIKIDVEGYELEVLKGLSKPVNYISFEYTVPEQISRVSECIEQIEKTNPKIECNYSIGESMVFHSPNWLSVEKMKKHIFTKEFTNTGFGDVYVRKIS